jgi:hypothetical protein
VFPLCTSRASIDNKSEAAPRLITHAACAKSLATANEFSNDLTRELSVTESHRTNSN